MKISFCIDEILLMTQVDLLTTLKETMLQKIVIVEVHPQRYCKSDINNTDFNNDFTFKIGSHGGKGYSRSDCQSGNIEPPKEKAILKKLQYDRAKIHFI